MKEAFEIGFNDLKPDLYSCENISLISQSQGRAHFSFATREHTVIEIRVQPVWVEGRWNGLHRLSKALKKSATKKQLDKYLNEQRLSGCMLEKIISNIPNAELNSPSSNGKGERSSPSIKKRILKQRR